MLLPWLQKSHNETVSKLSFVLALVECIIDLAQSRSSPLSESVTEKVLSSSPGGGTATMDHISFMSEGDRCIEQLVLYVRALQLLSSSIQLAKEEVSAGRLHPSNNVRACEWFICVLWLYLARSPCSGGVIATCSDLVHLPLSAPSTLCHSLLCLSVSAGFTLPVRPNISTFLFYYINCNENTWQ